jgi:CDP-glucose 4,6-dehydratase
VEVNPEFWRGKKVFVTGHTGFKGSWLSLWLQELGANVTGYALDPVTSPSLYVKARVEEGMTSIIGDIRDLDFFSKCMREASPEIVFHMAAQLLVRYSYANPVETYETNVMGTVNMLESVRHSPGVKAVVNITTDKCYENREWLWGYRETDPMGGYDPYSSSKGCAELVSAAYRTSYFNPAEFEQHGVAVATVRAGNVIGGGDWAEDRLIPDIVTAFAKGNQVQIRSPHAVRPWQHVVEPLRGYLMLAERLIEDGPIYSESWNFGPRDEDVKTVQWIVEKIANCWGDGASWQVDNNQHPHEASYLKLDISKAVGKLGWQPKLSLDDALNLIVSWSKQVIAGDDAGKLTRKQIHDYQQI